MFPYQFLAAGVLPTVAFMKQSKSASSFVLKYGGVWGSVYVSAMPVEAQRVLGTQLWSSAECALSC